MKLEAIRLLANAAADATIGVNAKIAALTIDAGDAAPPAIATICTDIAHPWVARRKWNAGDATLPALAIFEHDPLELDAEILTVDRDGVLSVGFALIMQKADTAAMTRDGFYIDRALQRFFASLMALDQGHALRAKNGVIIRRLLRLTQPNIDEAWGNAHAIAATIAAFKVRDLQTT